MSSFCLALDIGGTKIAAGVISEAGEILFSSSIATPQPNPWKPDSPEIIFEEVASLLEKISGEFAAQYPHHVLEVCGVGCGGPMARFGESVSPLNIPSWRQFPLRQRLAARFSQKVAIDNDAKALALGEFWQGGAKNLRNFIAVVVSTGVGGGIFIDGRLLDGESGNCGHLGHIIVEPQGRSCACGSRGCLEAEISGTAVQAIIGRPASQADDAMKLRVGQLAGRAIASVANLLDLKVALVAGSVALGYGDAFFRAAQQELDNCARLDFSAGAQIRPGKLGANGPLIGAGAVGFRSLGKLDTNTLESSATGTNK